jgi:hypothetical protein
MNKKFGIHDYVGCCVWPRLRVGQARRCKRPKDQIECAFGLADLSTHRNIRAPSHCTGIFFWIFLFCLAYTPAISMPMIEV